MKDKITLQSLLDEQRKSWESKADVEVKRIFAAGIETVIDSGVFTTARKKGDHAVDFKLKNAVNKSVTLSEYLLKGPVILTWYRGGWCPYCNITLRKLSAELPLFKELGANLLALTPELPDKSMSTIEKNSLDFEVLSDRGNKIAKKYGIVFKLNSEVAQAYNKDFDLNAFNGDNSNELPLPATYVIGADGMIKYAFLNANHRYRAEPEEIIKVLKRIQAISKHA